MEKYLADLPHDVVEGIFVRIWFFLKLILVEAKQRHHEFIDVMEGNVEGVGLIGEIEVNNLNEVGITCSISAILKVVISL